MQESICIGKSHVLITITIGRGRLEKILLFATDKITFKNIVTNSLSVYGSEIYSKF